MKSKRDRILAVIAAAAVLLAVVIVWRTLTTRTPPAAVDQDVLEADRQMNEQMQQQAPPEPQNVPEPPRSRTPGGL